MSLFSSLSSKTVLFIVMAVFTVLAVVLSLSGLSTVRQSLDGSNVDVALIVALLPFALWSYGLRTLRWHTLIRSIVPNLSPLLSGYSQLVGFAFSVTPGRVAELYKLKLLERSTGVSVAQSFPAVLIERVTEGVALGLLVAVGGVLHLSAVTTSGTMLPLTAAGIGLAILFTVRLLRRRVSHHALARLALGAMRRIPGGRRCIELLSHGRVATAIADLRAGGTNVTRPSTLVLGLALVVMGRLGDGLVLWKLSLAVGYPLAFPLAMMIVGASGLAGGISLTPGGIGAAEASFVALISANGMPFGLAVITTFAMRALLYWLWVVLGLAVFAAGHGYLISKQLPIGSSPGVWRQALFGKTTQRREG